jgi:ribosomal protein S6--L-glutamate ligase
MKQRTTIGWNEFVAFPDWGVRKLTAKVDTGARTSALHVEHVRVLTRGRISFEVVVDRARRDRHVPVVARISRRARVRSSNGEFESRYFVETEISIGPVTKTIEISLVNRAAMNHRMLLGRTALARDFVVDVSRRHLLDPKRKPRTTR